MDDWQTRMQAEFKSVGCSWCRAEMDCAVCFPRPIRPAPIITVTESTQVIHRPAYFFGGKSREGFFPDLMFGILAGDWT